MWVRLQPASLERQGRRPAQLRGPTGQGSSLGAQANRRVVERLVAAWRRGTRSKCFTVPGTAVRWVLVGCAPSESKVDAMRRESVDTLHQSDHAIHKRPAHSSDLGASSANDAASGYVSRGRWSSWLSRMFRFKRNREVSLQPVGTSHAPPKRTRLSRNTKPRRGWRRNCWSELASVVVQRTRARRSPLQALRRGKRSEATRPR